MRRYVLDKCSWADEQTKRQMDEWMGGQIDHYMPPTEWDPIQEVNSL